VRHGKRTHALVADFDESYRHLSPGSILDFNVMQHIFENGTAEYDMGCGDSFYKAHWTETSRKHLGLNFSRNTLYGRTLMFVEKKIVPILKTCKDTLKKKRGPEPNGGQSGGREEA
jgi:CelD/BcsL family acetyltransferase involved in cellulose biosynthesis